MPSVKNFPLLTQLSGDTPIPVAGATQAGPEGNFLINPNLLASWLEANGFPRNVAAVPVRFYDDFADLPAGVANTLYVVKGNGRGLYTWDGASFNHLYDVNAGNGNSSAGSRNYVSLSASGITVEVSYYGDTAPTLTGSNGSYSLNFTAGNAPGSISIEAPDGETNTSGDDFSFTVQADRRYKASVQLEDLGTGTISNQIPGVSIVRTSSQAGQETINVNAIASVTTGFGVQLNF